MFEIEKNVFVLQSLDQGVEFWDDVLISNPYNEFWKDGNPYF